MHMHPGEPENEGPEQEHEDAVENTHDGEDAMCPYSGQVQQRQRGAVAGLVCIHVSMREVIMVPLHKAKACVCMMSEHVVVSMRGTIEASEDEQKENTAIKMMCERVMSVARLVSIARDPNVDMNVPARPHCQEKRHEGEAVHQQTTIVMLNHILSPPISGVRSSP